MTDDYIEHYGVPRRSGRYPWGSGDTPYQGGGESSINGIARDLNNRNLTGAAKSLGLSNKTITDAKSNSDYNSAKVVLFGAGGSGTENREEKTKPYGPDNKPEKLPSNAFWDKEKKCWCANASVAYWDEGKGVWETAGGNGDSRIYYSDIHDRWVDENGENVAEESVNPDALGSRRLPDGVPWRARWDPKEERWVINSVNTPTKQWNDRTKSLEPVVRNEKKNTWEPAVWNPSTKSYEPKDKVSKVWNEKNKDWDVFEWNPSSNSYELMDETAKERRKKEILSKVPGRNPPQQKNWVDSLKSALNKMGAFFEQKISDIISGKKG